MKKSVLATVLALAAGGAFAQVYVGGAYSSLRVDADCDGMLTCKKTSSGYKAYIGYQVHPLVAIEAGYIDLGTLKTRTPDLGVGEISTNFSSTAFFVGGALRKDIGWGFGGVARLGLANVKTETSFQITAGPSGAVSDRSFRPMIGLGLEYAVVPHMKITADLDLVKTAEIEAANQDVGTVRAISIGARFLF